jgi:O-antigen biosynthesis protein WbqP
MLRILDVLLSLAGLILTLPLMIMLLLLGFLDTGSPLLRQMRVGRHQQPFALLKFRTMRPDTAWVATHLVDPTAITPLGRFLRRTKLDELPQLWNVLCGDMSLVGPRPCLFNQYDLIDERAALGVFDARPGITGLAQINNIDMSTPRYLAQTDALMLQKLNALSYFRLILMTLIGRGFKDRVNRDSKT